MLYILTDMYTGVFTICMANPDGTLDPIMIMTAEYFKRHLAQCMEAWHKYQQAGIHLDPRVRQFIEDLETIDQIKETHNV